MAKIAVLTGDLIGSTELTPDEVEDRLNAIKRALDAWADSNFDPCFTRQSGDGWQAIIEPSRKALRATLYVRAWLRHFGADQATRIFVATGKATVPDSGNLNDATQPVFVASGRGLVSLSKRTRIGHDGGGGIAAATRLADHISQGWTKAQARVMVDSLKGIPQSQIAKGLGITQQAVQQTQAAAGFPAINDALSFIETTDA